jgi:hypothetical protein
MIIFGFISLLKLHSPIQNVGFGLLELEFDFETANIQNHSYLVARALGQIGLMAILG